MLEKNQKQERMALNRSIFFRTKAQNPPSNEPQPKLFRLGLENGPTRGQQEANKGPKLTQHSLQLAQLLPN